MKTGPCMAESSHARGLHSDNRQTKYVLVQTDAVGSKQACPMLYHTHASDPVQLGSAASGTSTGACMADSSQA